MKFFITIIIVVLLALSLFLAMSVGVACGLVWIFPAISFEIGVLIGTVSLGMIFLFLITIINKSSQTYLPFIDDDDDIVDKIYDQYDLDQITPPRSTRRNRRRRR
jgi:hypothetical protein